MTRGMSKNGLAINLSTQINYAHREKKSIILQGDFNVNIMDHGSHLSQDVLDAECDLFQLINEPTHVTHHH